MKQLLLSFFFFCIASIISHVQSVFISIDAHAEECFHDKVTSGTKMSLMFEVAEGGFLDIDVKVHVDLLQSTRDNLLLT